MANHIQFRQLYLKYFSSIAFFPSVIGLFIILLAFLCMYLDKLGVGMILLDHAPYLVTQDMDSARVLLTTLVGGTFSLMVFSFTMVMVILTTATGYYSPRVLPGLISKKNHQMVLGLYLGTIAFTTIIILNIGKEDFEFAVPDLSVLVSVLLVFGCLAAFISFIHSVSQNVQAGHILHNLYEETKEQIEKELKSDYVEIAPAIPGRWQLKSPDTGYFQGINQDVVLELSSKHGVQILILPEKGKFLIKGAPLAWLSKELPAEALEKIQGQMNFYFQEHISINYLYGFKHITEVAVKALSPGINDPGTAITAIDYLTDLFLLLQPIGRYKVVKDDQEQTRLFYRQASWEKVFYYVFSSIRNYAAKDVAVQSKLLQMLHELMLHEPSSKQKELIQKERRALLENADKGFDNSRDLDVLFNDAEL